MVKIPTRYSPRIDRIEALLWVITVQLNVIGFGVWMQVWK